jgi:succinate dehydrogenase / fumarate reductase membrane anchor subunit
MVNRQVVGAHYGLRDWLAQRITAVIMLVFTLLVLLALLTLPKFDFWHWQALWNLSLMRYAALLFFVEFLYQAWVGVRNIFMDYIKDSGMRLTLYVVVILALISYGAWAVQFLWGK